MADRFDILRLIDDVLIDHERTAANATLWLPPEWPVFPHQLLEYALNGGPRGSDRRA